MKAHRIEATSQQKQHEKQLGEALAEICTAEEALFFLQDLCTPMEIQAMVDRWRVVPLIKAGKPYRQIYEETGVSVTTIGRVARCIHLGNGGYNIIYDRIEKKANEEFKTTYRHSKKRKIK